MIDREQIENWNGGPAGESLEQLCKPISARKMPRKSLFGCGHAAVSEQEAMEHQRRHAGNSLKPRGKRKRE